MMRCTARGIAAWVLLWGLGCGDGQDDEQEVVAIGAAHAVELRDGRVWLDLSGDGQLTALGQLAKAADFDLELHAFRPRPAAIRLEGVTLAEAVAALVGDASFAFEYAFDAEQARHEIVVLHVGTSGLTLSPAAGHGGGIREDGATPSPGRSPPDSETDALAEGERSVTRETSSRARIESARERVAALRESLRRAEGEQRRELGNEYDQATEAFQEQLREALSDPDPFVRAQMLGEIEIDSGDARHRIGLLARSDPSPRVRVAAAETLGEDGTFQAVAELIGMLDDREPDVLIATLEALDFSGDESIEPYIEPLSGHPDSQVREKANEMLEFWK